MSTSDWLVAGVGNVFHGDDAFGVEVVRALREGPLPAGVTVREFGIRGMDLAFALMEAERALLLDAMPRGAAPGTLTLLEPTLPARGTGPTDGHGFDVGRVLAYVRRVRGGLPLVRILGCEPGRHVLMEEGLSPAVADAVPRACAWVLRILADDLPQEGVSGLS